MVTKILNLFQILGYDQQANYAKVNFKYNMEYTRICI